jgi:hypothetical protein
VKLTLKIKDKEYSISRDLDNPDADNIMFAIESLVNQIPELDTNAVEEYILGWAEEIQNSK